MKLITEGEDRNIVETLIERSEDGSKTLFIEGIYMQSERENRNKRIYPKGILESAVETFNVNKVLTGRAVGELGHPLGPKINLDNVSHRITELHWEGNDVYGKAQILDTPKGMIVQGLLNGGVKLGVSSRGMGSVQNKSGKSYVTEDYILATVDIVHDPSAQEAFVNGIMEGVEFFLTEDGHIEKCIDGIKKRIHATPSRQLDEIMLQEWNNFLTVLKG